MEQVGIKTNWGTSTMRIIALFISLLPSLVMAQTSPNFHNGPPAISAQQLNAAFSRKQDFPASVPIVNGLAPIIATVSGGATSIAFDYTFAGTFTALQRFNSGITVTGSFTATGLVTNADLVNQSVSINSVTCTLGSSCSIAAAASLIAGSTTVSGACTTGFVLYNNAGILGCEAAGGGSGNVSNAGTPTNGQIAQWTNATTIQGLATTGTGSAVLATSPTMSGATVTGSFTATGLVTNGDLANPSVTVNGQTCTLGSSCTVSGAATSITVGTTTVVSGTTQQLLYDNAGTLGEVAKANSSVLISGGTGVPSWATTLPSGLSAPSLTVTGSFTATGLVTNADLVNVSITVNGTVCTLGSSCTVTAAAGTLTGSTLAAGVTASSLTSVGTLASLAISGSLTTNITGSSQCVQASSSGVLSGTGAPCGSGSGAVNSVTNSDSTLTISPTTGAVVASLALGHANTWTATQTLSGLTLSAITGSTQCLQVNTSGVVSGVAAACGTATTFANPSASVGLSAVNGSATTAMRSDAAPALSQAIAPTWTGQHIWTVARTVASASGAALDDVDVTAATSTLTGTTGVTRFSKVSIYQPTFTDASAVTITNAASFYVDNAPVAGGSVTLTNTWAILVGAGATKLQATTLSGALTYGGVTLSNAVTGTGNMVLSASPSMSAVTVTGSFTATGLVTNADLVNVATTVNGQTCTLGSTCTITATAASITVATTTISGGTTQQILYDNAGVLGEITKANSSVLISSGAGVPSWATTLPSGLTAPSLTVTTAFTATGLVGLTNLAVQTANTVVGNATSGSASPTALAVGSCSTASSALIWTTNTGFGCNTSITAAAVPASGITGQVALANGGTSANLTASNGGIFYSAASAAAILAGTATANQCLLSGSSAAPTWGSCAIVSAANVFTALQTISINSSASGVAGLLMSVIQTQANPTDTSDSAVKINYNLSASTATNELVNRVFLLNATNTLIGGGTVTNMRILDIVGNTASGTTTGELAGIYLEAGVGSGTVTNGVAIHIGSWQGASGLWGIKDDSGGVWSNTSGAGSFSPTTGAITTLGGIGLGGSINGGGNNLSMGNTVSGTTTTILALGPNSGANAGALISVQNNGNNIFLLGNKSSVFGGSYDATSILYANSFLQTYIGTVTSANYSTITNTFATAATSGTTGTFQVQGGVGVVGDSWFAGKVTVTGGTTTLGTTSNTISALQIIGPSSGTGAGAQFQLLNGANNNWIVGNRSAVNGSGAYDGAPVMYTASAIYVYINAFPTSTSNESIIINTAATAATSTTTGTLQINGGLASNLASWFGDSVNIAGAHISVGTKPVGNTGSCTVGITLTGGSTAGTWSSTGICGTASTVVLSSLPTAPTGYACFASDRSTANVVLQQTGSSVTSATFTVRTTAMAANDIVEFGCSAY